MYRPSVSELFHDYHPGKPEQKEEELNGALLYG